MVFALWLFLLELNTRINKNTQKYLFLHSSLIGLVSFILLSRETVVLFHKFLKHAKFI